MKLLVGLSLLLATNLALAYPKCSLYEPYRCIPVYGNKIICGCGL